MLTVGSLFSGVEGFGLGLERAGMELRWSVEVDPSCRKVLARHWPDVVCHGDIKELDPDDLSPVDLICGGFPCQGLSVAGQRRGLGDDRSGLFWEFARILAACRPRWAVVENVPGLLSAVCPGPDGERVPGGGCEGGCMARHGGAMGLVLGTLGQLGYGWAYRVLDARHFGLAQRRERVFIVCCLGDRERAQQVLLESQGRGRDSAPGGEAGTLVAALTTNGVGTCGADDNQAQAGHLITGALTHHYGKGTDSDATDALVVADTLRSHPRAGSNSNGALAIRCPAGGKNDASGAHEWDMTPTLPSSQTIAVAYPLAMRGRDDGAELEMGEEGTYNALRSADGGSSRQNLVAYSTKLHNTESNQAGKVYEEYTPGLQSGSPPPAVAYGATPVRAHGAHGAGVGREGDPSLTLDADGSAAVVYRKAQKAHHADDCERWEADDLAATIDAGGQAPRTAQAVVAEMAVRRLTPTECERLQGFPDGWTDGAYDHYAGKRGSQGIPGGVSDSVRYRMLGNAAPVPVVEWIGRRIVAVDAA